MSDVPAVYRVLAGRFGDEIVPDSGVTLDDVRRYVAAHVARLLDLNPGLLMSILYRIDVAEDSVRAVFERERPEAIPNTLADLIVTRQLEKLETRRRHRRGDPS